ncbi:hypothetical protein JVT61DRAFT_11601 [Boletus reticuloceps]|uniref:Uncharacterized protein n=1 Tax=Boletus reticuloceps TaxID=495285 RepID=A0A8I3AE81_9AGAM|nr:hypothetical protein JVT61DRAFT_11601 [Boletus reticuloceps]
MLKFDNVYAGAYGVSRVMIAQVSAMDSATNSSRQTEPTTVTAPAPTTSSSDTTTDVVASCKRRISELQEEIEQIRDAQKKGKPDDNTYLIVGRCIRRLVSLTDRVEDLVHEADRRACLDDPNVSCGEEADRLYSAYKQLVHWQPSLGRLINSQEHLPHLTGIFRELNQGADSSRGDDAASLKRSVIHWLKVAFPHAKAGLEPDEKTGRGFDHDLTGRLLCPVDYNWEDDQQRAAICDFHPDFLVTADSWPAFLYEGERYDSQKPTEGLFKNALLLKAFKHVFTSPTSALKTDIVQKPLPRSEKPQKRDERRTRRPVASKLGMTSISPRAIAYIAVQLRFALSDCGSWRITDGEFNHCDFYNNIIAFFENTGTADRKTTIQDILFWWNRQVLGREYMSVYRPRNTKNLSVALSLSNSHGSATNAASSSAATREAIPHAAEQ